MSIKIFRSLAAGPVLMCSLAIIGCSAQKYDGQWEGKTAQGKSIKFTVSNGVIKKTRLEYDFDCERGGFCPVGGSTEQDIDAEISWSSFSAVIDEKNTFSGKFVSAGEASGDLMVVQKETPCGTCTTKQTWTAKKL